MMAIYNSHRPIRYVCVYNIVCFNDTYKYVTHQKP